MKEGEIWEEMEGVRNLGKLFGFDFDAGVECLIEN
jgi:hypothetical protein